ncbi:MAG: hypothetical protein ACJA1L_003152 [Paracoccaceae bacterium]|jgi:hypothetical protein
MKARWPVCLARRFSRSHARYRCRSAAGRDADRATKHREAARVLRRVERSLIYGVVKGAQPAMRFTTPVADAERTSHPVSAKTLRGLLSGAGFSVLEGDHRR